MFVFPNVCSMWYLVYAERQTKRHILNGKDNIMTARPLTAKNGMLSNKGIPSCAYALASSCLSERGAVSFKLPAAS